MNHPIEALHDYAMGELAPAEYAALEQHVAVCGECAVELDRLRITTAALRILPDREIPQRIAFVSDKVFQPSPLGRFFGGFRNSAAWLGFASACVLSGAIVFSASHRPAEIRTVVQAANVDVSKQVNDAVTKAVAQVRAEDAVKIEKANQKIEREYDARLAEVAESYAVLQKRLGSSLLASADLPRAGGGQ